MRGAIAIGLVCGGLFGACGEDPSTSDGTTGASGGSSAGDSVATGDEDPTAATEPDPVGDSTASSDEAGETTFGCAQTWYPDEDADGYGDVQFPVDACLQPPGHIPQGGDCDDTNPDVHPGVDEVCDMADNDCNGLVDEASAQNTECQGCTLGLMGDHAYYYCPQTMAHADAQLVCAGWAGDLLKLDDQAEQDFVLAEPLPGDGQYTIGLNDIEVEGTFVWPDGTVPRFLAWGMGEPNDALDGEDCVQLSVPAGTWNDIACTTAGAFICEAVGS
ncbi:MAG: lectin-like protein [Myxococcota bacterium]